MKKRGMPENLTAKGRIKHLSPEERTEMSRKGGLAKAANLKARREMENKLKDSQGMLRESVAAVMANDPEALTKIIENIAKKAMDPEDKTALQAADIFLKHSGITAPKQVEQTVDDKRDIQDATKELESLGVSITGLKVVGGKDQ